MAAPRHSSKYIVNELFQIFAGHEEAFDVIWVVHITGLYQKTAMGALGGKGNQR